MCGSYGVWNANGKYPAGSAVARKSGGMPAADRRKRMILTTIVIARITFMSDKIVCWLKKYVAVIAVFVNYVFQLGIYFIIIREAVG